MGFNDDNFLDDYEIQELINRFENQLESGMPLFFDADEFNIIADLASTYHTTNPLTNLIMAKKYLSVQDASNALPYLLDETNNTEDADYQLSLGYCYSLLEEHNVLCRHIKKRLSFSRKRIATTFTTQWRWNICCYVISNARFIISKKD